MPVTIRERADHLLLTAHTRVSRPLAVLTTDVGDGVVR
jgi:hypothetical protein